MNKIFSFDLDGTLLNSNEIVPKSAIKALEIIEKNKDLSIINTGRHFYSSATIAKSSGIRYGITLNGAMIYDYDKETVIWKKSYSISEFKKIIEFNLNFNSSAYIYTERKILIWKLGTEDKHLDEYFKKYFPKNNFIVFSKNVKIDEVVKYINSSNDSIVKIIFHTNKIGKEYDEIYDSYKNNLSEISSLYKGIVGSGHIELSALNTSKYLGILQFKSKVIGDSSIYTVSFGDNYNDIEAFENSDFSYVMDTANKSVSKYASEIISSSDNDGILEGVMNFYKLKKP